MKKIAHLTVLFTVAALPFAEVDASLIFTFDHPVTLTEEQAPGAWYRNRYSPAGFESQVFFDGDNRLRLTIAASDGADHRPSIVSTAFYDTQGRAFDVATDTTFISADLYIDASWETTGRRMGGFWGTARTYANPTVNNAFPIIDFTSDNNNPRFRGWSGQFGWLDMGLPTGFTYDTWYTLNIELVGSEFIYTVGDLTLSVTAFGSDYIGNVILHGQNTQAGVDYVMYWDNVVAVPEPSSLAYLVIAAAGFLAARRWHMIST
ncbi:MAG TPA: PEP-CTERM sorting domain-containing protein [Kiritimatiellia bacterium]|nr:PEP-CTERM sorting domain-containing protein [Kiritimatiellia bacterium]